jgi:hypothetical protein
MAQLVDNKYEPREWSKDFIEVMIDFKKNQKLQNAGNIPQSASSPIERRK